MKEISNTAYSDTGEVTKIQYNAIFKMSDKRKSVKSNKSNQQDVECHTKKNLVNRIKNRIKSVLNSNCFQLIVISLVLVDTICVSSELIITIENNKYSLGYLKIIHNCLKYLGISILAAFLTEIFLKLIFNTREFFKSKLEIFDSIIIVISFVLDIVYFNYDSAAFELITLLRLWRIGRIINGLI